MSEILGLRVSTTEVEMTPRDGESHRLRLVYPCGDAYIELEIDIDSKFNARVEVCADDTTGRIDHSGQVVVSPRLYVDLQLTGWVRQRQGDAAWRTQLVKRDVCQREVSTDVT